MANDIKISQMKRTSSLLEDAIIPIVEQGMNKSTTVGDIIKPVKDQLNNKQDTLISGTNIKTINSQSILGKGNIDIQNTGTTNYNDLTNKPQINSIELTGNKTLDELNIQQKGDFATKAELNTKLNILESGNNIRTINNQSIIGSGNLDTKPKGGYSRALFETAGAKYNETTGFYELNGLTDITEEEMSTIYSYNVQYISNGTFRDCKARTLFPFNQGQCTWLTDLYECFSGCENLEIIVFKSIARPKNMHYIFLNCVKLKTISGVLNVSKAIMGNNPFLSCLELINIKLLELKTNISFKDSPNLTKESILYMIQNSAATSAITITLHPTAYTMAMADSDIQAALQEKTFVSLAQG